MKPRTVILTLELRDCETPLGTLRRVTSIVVRSGSAVLQYVDVAQATATVAQPSTPKGKRR